MLTRKSRNSIIRGIIRRRSPIYVQYALSKSCNLRCRMCGAVDARANERELNLNEIEILADRMDRLKVGVLILTGGEPFIRKDLPEIIKIFSKKDIDVRLQTNAILATEESIKQVIAAGLKEVTISLDTMDKNKQDFICNKKGTWDKIIESISLFSEYLPKKGAMPIINTVVSKLNINDITDVVKFTTRIDFYNSIIPIHSSITNGFVVRKESEPFKFTKKDFRDIDETYKNLIRMKKQGYNVHNTYKFLKKSPDFLKYNKIYWKCDSPHLYFSISPQGYFLPCVDLKGDKSILDKDFIDVFRSKEFIRKIRNQVKNCPGCMYACYPEISYLCKDPLVLLERIKQGLLISKKERNAYTYEEMLDIIKDIKKAKENKNENLSCKA